MGETIHQEATGKLETCPVCALALRVFEILSNKGAKENLLCVYFKNERWNSIASSEIRNIVKTAAKVLQLQKQAIDLDLVVAHSLLGVQ